MTIHRPLLNTLLTLLFTPLLAYESFAEQTLASAVLESPIAVIASERLCNDDGVCVENTTYVAETARDLRKVIPNSYDGSIIAIPTNDAKPGVYAPPSTDEALAQKNEVDAASFATTASALSVADSFAIKPNLILVLPDEVPPTPSDSSSVSAYAASLWNKQHAILTVSRMTVVGVSTYVCLMMAGNVGHPTQATAIALSGTLALWDAVHYQLNDASNFWVSRRGIFTGKSSQGAKFSETFTKTVLYGTMTLAVSRYIRNQFNAGPFDLYELPMILSLTVINSMTGLGWIAFNKQIALQKMDEASFAFYKRISFLSFIVASIGSTAIDSGLNLLGAGLRIGYTAAGGTLAYYGLNFGKLREDIKKTYLKARGMCDRLSLRLREQRTIDSSRK